MSCFIASGASHLKVVKKGNDYYYKMHDGERVNLHKLSIEVLFDSIARTCVKSIIGIMLTGMGAVGAAMLRMKEAGSYNDIQGQESSVVLGIPGAAHEQGAGDKILSLNKIVGHVVTLLKRK